MPKRKRDVNYGANGDADHIASRALQAQRQQFEGALDNGKIALFRALKIGRGFERQKLGRRHKAAKVLNSDEELVRLSAEVAALKALDLTAVAELHLYKSLVKIKSLTKCPTFPTGILHKVKSTKPASDIAYANVTARLYNSNPVRTAMTEVIATIRRALGVSEASAGPQRRVRAADYSTADAELQTGRERPATATLVEEDDKWEGFSGSEHSTHIISAASGDEQQEEEAGFQQYASRLASSSASPSPSDSDNPPNRRASSYSPLPLQRALSKPQTQTSKPRTTTFLPSLATGYISNSSDPNSSDSDAGALPALRKNRRGQQARRQLWEKKFGKAAHHVRRESRDLGWDLRKGAVGTERGGRGVRVSGANSEAVVLKERNGGEGREKGKEKDRQGPLHPSWEAARRLKERKAVVAFEGRKIVFD